MRYVIRFPATKNGDWVPMYWTNFANSQSPLVTATDHDLVAPGRKFS